MLQQGATCLLHAVHELGLREGRNDSPKIVFEFVEDPSRLTVCITFNDATTGGNEVLVNTRMVQRGTVENRRMAGAMPQDD